MVSLQKEYENQMSIFSEESLKKLIHRLKKKRKYAEIKKLQYTSEDQARASTIQIAEKRKRNNLSV
jgi:hypothetical protein